MNLKKRVCEFCGEPLSKSDIFCRGCGAKVSGDEIVKDAIIEGEKKDSNTGFILSIIIIILVIIVLGGLFYLFT